MFQENFHHESYDGSTKALEELNIGRTIQVLNSLLPQYKRRTPTPKLEGDLLQEKVEFGKGKSGNYLESTEPLHVTAKTSMLFFTILCLDNSDGNITGLKEVPYEPIKC